MILSSFEKHNTMGGAAIRATKKGTRGGLGPPRRSQICHQKVPNLTSEGPKLYLRSKNGLKKEENAWLCLHNASLEGPELFGPPKILAQLRLWTEQAYYSTMGRPTNCKFETHVQFWMKWNMTESLQDTISVTKHGIQPFQVVGNSVVWGMQCFAVFF